ncbi:PUA domain-containing protein [Tieghemostelium lacteum]|uniref:glutathione-specific gamma-glutamylcyclotransferase n=1 Tax=Tieghemostelium lacteum TaxID=361077 RepID=A0A151ZA70_TIELA|nr:PUA domain-containing protein [Tieghemostelium lacteum]|eukprot:KYQ90838.1 PUA domain-containing protein [Tieghemostelium lacteum]
MCEELLVYLFGYGSLMWRPGFKYVRKFNAYIKRYKRVFYQGSTDHRGTVEAPGRVVTLIKQPESSTQDESLSVAAVPGGDNQDQEEWITWGTVYCVSDDDAVQILKNLDYREKGGYERHELEVFVDDKQESVGSAIVYLATTENSEYLGEDSIENIAMQIFKSVGPSGRNIDYLLKLANSLHEINVVDDHVFSIEKEVLALMEKYQITDGFIHNSTSVATSIIRSGSPDGKRTVTATSSATSTTTFTLTNSSSNNTSDIALQQVLEHRKFYQDPKGKVVIDDGAVEAISQRAKSLLPIGIVKVIGDFQPNELISIFDSNSQEISRGIINYSSKDLQLIIGKQSKEIPTILSKKDFSETVIDQKNLILL